MTKTNERTLSISKTQLKFLNTFQMVFLNATQNTLLPEIIEIFGIEMTMKFLDIFAGTTITIPSRKRFIDCVRDADIFMALSPSDGEDEDIVIRLASKHNLDRQTVLAAYNRTKSITSKVMSK